MITIEEAHKFLSPGLAEQTIFGTIAREMRKYSVTLLVIDQRPSGIDPEIEVKENVLTVQGRKAANDETRRFLHRGLAERNFERRFQLADHVVVTRSEHIPRIQEAQASAHHVLRALVG